MNLLHRRLLKLERHFPPSMPPDTVSKVQALALQRLSMTELEILRDVARRGDWENSLSEAEQSAMNSYKEALVAVATELKLPLGAPEVELA
jgi:hypothetical protein